MTDWLTWFQNHLKSSGEGLEWAFSRIDPAHHRQRPPNPPYLGLWEPLRHLWHVTEYERCIALPVMQQWLGGPMLPADDDVWPDTDAAWWAISSQPAEAFVSAFQTVRKAQLDLLAQFAPADWEMLRQTVWGPRPLSMVITKTYQHTFEHGDTLLRMGMWWADMAQDEADQGVEQD